MEQEQPVHKANVRARVIRIPVGDPTLFPSKAEKLQQQPKGEKVPGSRKMSVEEAFGRLLEQGRLLPAPLPLANLAVLPEESSILSQCITAMEVNVESFGFDLEYIGPIDKEESKEVKAEKKRILNFIRTLHDRETLVSLRRKLRIDMETTGNGFLEVIRDAKGEIVMFEHLPAVTMALSPLDKDPIVVDVSMVAEDGEIIDRQVMRRFRRFAQVQDMRRIWFKEFGDPRAILAKDGKEAPDGTKAGDLATEVLHFALYTPRSAYGLPRWVGALPAVKGSRYAEIVNLSYFKKNAIPPVLVLVSGGALTDEAYEDLKNYFAAGAADLENYHQAIVLDAKPLTESLDQRGTVTIKVQPLQEARLSDAQFLNYDRDNRLKVRSAFRLSPLFVGVTDEANFATAQAARITAEEQIFAPERDRFDQVMNLQVFRDMGFRFWAFYTKGPEIADVGVYTAAVRAFAEVGAITVNQAIALANELLGTTTDPIEEEWGDYPFPMVMGLLQQGKLAGLDAISEMDPIAEATALAQLEKAKQPKQFPPQAGGGDQGDQKNKPPPKEGQAGQKEMKRPEKGVEPARTAAAKADLVLGDLADAGQKQPEAQQRSFLRRAGRGARLWRRTRVA